MNTPFILVGCVILVLGGIRCQGLGPGNDESPEIPGDSLEYFRAACVTKINAYRATENKPALERWSSEESCADNQAKSDSETNRAHGSFGECGEKAQNECPGWGSFAQIINGCLESMWNEGPYEGPWDTEHGHYLNMNNSSYTLVACGFYRTPTGRIWSVQNFK